MKKTKNKETKLFLNYRQILLPLVFVFVSNQIAFCDTLKIYENLIQCYRENNTKPFISNSLQILLELIRKIENNYPTSINIRELSVSLIHNLRIDGIERAPGIPETDLITPFRPNGIQVPKYELLLNLISNIPTVIKFDNILTKNELCTLHKLISSSIEPFKRGDEVKTCSYLIDQNSNLNYFLQNVNKVKISQNHYSYVIPGSISKCPIEMGVIRTLQYGSLSPGTVIASIAAALQPQSVQIKDIFPTIRYKSRSYGDLESMHYEDDYDIIDEDFKRKLSKSADVIDNVYAAGLAGDLAEVCIHQAPYFKENVNIGLSGYWNSTEYPLIRYLKESYKLEWTMTDSEILAGIDSYHLATYVSGWLKRIQTMRLSQVLEMYYSPRGIPNFSIETTNRGNKKSYSGNYDRRVPEFTSKLVYGSPLDDFSSVYKSKYYDPDRYIIGDNIDSACERKHILNRISKDRLKEQTYFFAQILQYSMRTMTINDSLIKSVCYSSVDQFFEYSNRLLDTLSDCDHIGRNYIHPKIDLTLIIDGSRTRYQNLKLISYLSEIIDVSYYGSKISVIHGTTGKYLVKSTDSVMNAFEQLKSYTGPYPTTLSLIECFATVLNSLEESEIEKRQNEQIIGNSKVILVVSQSQKIRENDFIGAKRMFEGSFQPFNDLYFVFLTNDVQMFEDMIAGVPKLSGNSKQRYNAINAPNIEIKTFITELSQVLRSIPKWFRVPDDKEFENLKPIRNPGDPLTESKVDSNSRVKRFEYEQYISPNEIIQYEINGRALPSYERLQIEFINTDYGDITACLTKNSKDYQCQSTNIINPVQFNITHDCNEIDDNTRNERFSSLSSSTLVNNCSNYYVFKIDMDNSKVRCTENDCRYPDQVRFLIHLGNLRLENSATNLVISTSSVVFLLLNTVLFNQLFIC